MSSSESSSPDTSTSAGHGEAGDVGAAEGVESESAEPESPESIDGDLTEEPRHSLWFDLRRAVSGDHNADYTAGPIGRSVLLLAVPMVLETIMESIFAVVDVFFVAKLGSVAVTTVGLTESMMAIVYTVAVGLSIGVTAMVARRTGEKDPDGAARTAVQAVALGFGVAGFIGLIGAVAAPDLLRLMGADEDVVAMGTPYTRIMLTLNFTVTLLFLINAIYRGAGDAAIAMRVLWLANGINIVLDPMLIFGIGPFPELGVTGAAVATCIGRGTAVAVQLWLLFRGTGRINIERRHVRIEPQRMLRLVRLSGTATFQFFISTASWIGLIRILATFGSDVLAGYTIAIRVVIFALFPSWGLSNAAATMVGQALGAGKPERAEKAVWMTCFYNMFFLGGTGVLFFVFAPQIVSIFTTDPEPAKWAILCLRIVAVGFPFYAYGMVITQSFNGAGDTWTPTYLNLFCFWLFELPFGYF
ncbi:MAG: MATE family efflux transporter, partial [Acidobacteriota bacterium]